MRKAVVLFFLTVLFLSTTANAQYFGRNKVQWEHFDFKVLKTEHFDIYYYDREADVVNDVGRMAERWYVRLSRVFNHTFTRKPIVLYANPADFQQTTTTPEIIGQGTGGFTDPFMNRVVLPLTGDYAENDHVLGHELVHVFQFDVANTFSTNARRRFNLEQMPLWLVEGMAERHRRTRILVFILGETAHPLALFTEVDEVKEEAECVRDCRSVGQRKPVFVHSLICVGTLEERIDQLLESKRELAAKVIHAGAEDWLGALDLRAIRAAVALSPDWMEAAA